MNFKIISIIFFITAFIISLHAVQVTWNSSTDTDIAGYKIYWGTSSQNYTHIVDVGNVVKATIDDTNFTYNQTYYFAATCYDLAGDESGFSNEANWLDDNTPVVPLNITYVGVQVDYGVSLTTITSQRILVMSVTNSPGNFYSESLIITNNPFVGIKPVDGNNYVYIGTKIQYGTSLTTLSNSTFPLITFTNPPQYYYRSSLVLTNKSF